MSLKSNGIILVIGICIGGGAVYRLMPPSVPQVITKTDIKYKTRIVTLPDGTKTEVTEGQSVSDSRPAKKKYGVGLYHDKSVFLESRLGDMPLFLIGETDFKGIRVGIKLEF